MNNMKRGTKCHFSRTQTDVALADNLPKWYLVKQKQFEILMI